MVGTLRKLMFSVVLLLLCVWRDDMVGTLSKLMLSVVLLLLCVQRNGMVGTLFKLMFSVVLLLSVLICLLVDAVFFYLANGYIYKGH